MYSNKASPASLSRLARLPGLTKAGRLTRAAVTPTLLADLIAVYSMRLWWTLAGTHPLLRNALDVVVILSIWSTVALYVQTVMGLALVGVFAALHLAFYVRAVIEYRSVVWATYRDARSRAYPY